jgi:hypothetical protein
VLMRVWFPRREKDTSKRLSYVSYAIYDRYNKTVYSVANATLLTFAFIPHNREYVPLFWGAFESKNGKHDLDLKREHVAHKTNAKSR